MSMMSYKRTKAYSAEKGSIVKILSFECLLLSSIATVLLTSQNYFGRVKNLGKSAPNSVICICIQ